MKKTKLIDVFENPLTDGIFSYIADMSPSVPWGSDINPATLDAEYFGNISGQKTIAPLIKNIMLKDSTTNKLTEANLQQLATLIYKLNYKMWVKEYATLNFDYNPISNYDMTETETASGTNGNTRTNTGTQTDANTGTVSTTHTGTQTEENTGTVATTHTGTQGTSDTSSASGTSSGSSDRGLYGFNSSESVGDSTDATENETTTTATGSSTRTDNLTDERTDDTTRTQTDNLTDQRTDNTTHTRTDNLSESESGTHSDTRTLTRSGNIGVTTSQQMIEAERELNKWNYFYNIVFPSVDKVLTICLYS